MISIEPITRENALVFKDSFTGRTVPYGTILISASTKWPSGSDGDRFVR